MFEAEILSKLIALEHDVNKLKTIDRIDSTDFATVNHNHDTAYLGKTAKAADSDKLEGKHASATPTADTIPIGDATTGKLAVGWMPIYPVFLTAPLTSTAWDGDARSTTAKTLIDLSSVFGVPAGVKAVLAEVSARDSGAATTECRLVLGPTDTSMYGTHVICPKFADFWGCANSIVPCDANGDIYYQVVASGTGTMDVYLQIWGYWL